MFISLPEVFTIVEKYKYLVIFPITIFEGPIVIIISGFLTYLGFLNILIILPLLIVGDLIGDCLYYAIGRYGDRFSLVRKIGKFFSYREKSREFLKNHFEKHTAKTLLLGKIAHGAGALIQITAGMAGVNFTKYFFIELIGTLIKTTALFYVGYYIGNSYLKINSYLDAIAYTVMAFALLAFIYIILKRYRRRFEE